MEKIKSKISFMVQVNCDLKEKQTTSEVWLSTQEARNDKFPQQKIIVRIDFLFGKVDIKGCSDDYV